MRRLVRHSLLRVARGAGLFRLARYSTRRAVRILCYHGVWLGDQRFAGDAMFMRPETFRQRLNILRRLGYPVVSLSEAVDGLQGRSELPDNAIAITIDDGWYGTYAHMAPALREFGYAATLYCDTAHVATTQPIAHVLAAYLPVIASSRGDAVAAHARAVIEKAGDRSRPMSERMAFAAEAAELLDIDLKSLIDNRAFSYMSAEELKTAFDGGLSVELHTHNHTMHDGSTEAVLQEIIENQRTLADWLDAPPEGFRHFCYPSGIMSKGAISAFLQRAIMSATTTQQGLAWPMADQYQLPRLMDNGALSDIEFEAEVSGFLELLRRVLPARYSNRYATPVQIAASS